MSKKKDSPDKYELIAYSIYKIKDMGVYYYAPKRVYLRHPVSIVQTVVVGTPSLSKQHAIRQAKKYAKEQNVPFIMVVNRGDYLPPIKNTKGEKQNG